MCVCLNRLRRNGDLRRALPAATFEVVRQRVQTAAAALKGGIESWKTLTISAMEEKKRKMKMRNISIGDKPAMLSTRGAPVFACDTASNDDDERWGDDEQRWDKTHLMTGLRERVRGVSDKTSEIGWIVTDLISLECVFVGL